MLKFFIKQQLIYVPVIGIAWWALDFPIMKRYSREYLKKHPEDKGKDLEATRKACEKFKHLNVIDGLTEFVLERVRSIENAVKASNSLVNSLLHYSRGKIEEFSSTNVSDEMKQTLTIVNHSIIESRRQHLHQVVNAISSLVRIHGFNKVLWMLGGQAGHTRSLAVPFSPMTT